MEVSNKFISIVALGSFNPAILTLDFFEKHCEFLGDKRNIESRTTPVGSNLKYRNVELTVELSRYQIVEKNVRNPEKIEILKYFSNYFKVLKYTPIYKVGINFNSSINEIKPSVIDLLNNGEKIRKFLNIEDLIYSRKTKISKNIANELSWELCYKSKKDYQATIALSLKNSGVNINYNFEFSNTGNQKNICTKINKNYINLEQKNNKFLKNLIRGY